MFIELYTYTRFGNIYCAVLFICAFTLYNWYHSDLIHSTYLFKVLSSWRYPLCFSTPLLSFLFQRLYFSYSESPDSGYLGFCSWFLFVTFCFVPLWINILLKFYFTENSYFSQSINLASSTKKKKCWVCCLSSIELVLLLLNLGSRFQGDTGGWGASDVATWARPCPLYISSSPTLDFALPLNDPLSLSLRAQFFPDDCLSWIKSPRPVIL